MLNKVGKAPFTEVALRSKFGGSINEQMAVAHFLPQSVRNQTCTFTKISVNQKKIT